MKKAATMTMVLMEEQGAGRETDIMDRKKETEMLKRLEWLGGGGEYEEPYAALDVEDFVGLKRLESFGFTGWDCFDGRLEKVLRTVSGTLRELTMGYNIGIHPDGFSTLSQAPREEKGVDDDRDIVVDDGDGKFVLVRLESLVSYGTDPIDDYLVEFVKHCPNLRKFEAWLLDIDVQADVWDTRDPLRGDLEYYQPDSMGLAYNLRNYCPKLDTLVLTYPMRVHHINTLVRFGWTGGLRKLHIKVKGPEVGLASAIIQHAATLEDLRIVQERGHEDAAIYLHLLVECSRLTSFELQINTLRDDQNVLGALKGQRWGCRDLQRLELTLLRWANQNYTVIGALGASSVLSIMGWERLQKRDRDPKTLDRMDPAKLLRVLTLVEHQRLDHLQMLVWGHSSFKRSI
ncbi:hypothetical protein BGX29_011042 [Mortierella sp. GBA35]|nr:hypothetical protein BGX29_011042 [Mortierella sp. GBA35]